MQVHFGSLLRQWRDRRGLSQLTLANNADISPRHLSFLETGRSSPSREMILRLADELQVPLRFRNVLFAAAGFAAVYTVRSLDDSNLQAVMNVVQTVIKGHEPNPAMAIDQRWNIVAMNDATRLLTAGAAPELLRPPLNAMRIALHPGGLAPAILNFDEWHTHSLRTLKQRADATGDLQLMELLEEVKAYRYDRQPMGRGFTPHAGFAVPLRLSTTQGPVNLITTTMMFGLARDVTVSELAIECLFPADSQSSNNVIALGDAAVAWVY